MKEAIRGTHDFGGSADAECTASGFFLAQAEAVPCCRFLHVPREHLRARVVRQRGQNGHPESDVFYDSDVLSCVVMVSILRFFFGRFLQNSFREKWQGSLFDSNFRFLPGATGSQPSPQHRG